MSAKQPAKPAKDVIYVDVEDEITGIIDKVENSEHKVVALVLPKRAASLQSIVNMKLLKRSADGSGKNVVLITSEKALLPLAGAAGLHVARNLQSRPEIPDGPAGLPAAAPAAEEAEDVPEEAVDEEDLPGKFDYAKPIGALAAAHEAENPETIDLDDEEDEAPSPAPKKSAVEKVSVPNFDRFRLMLGLGIVGVILLIVFVILALFVLPKGTVTIHTTSEPVTAAFNLNASAANTSVDTAKGLIPAKLETSDQTGSQQVTATGQQNNGTKATGSVSMSDCVSGSSPSDVPAGTGVSTNGLTYITQQAAHFSPTFQVCGNGSGVLAKSNSVDITATQGGTKYNTSLSGASVAGFSGVSADGSASGGTDNTITVLSQNDVNTAKDKLTGGSAADDFTKNFKKKLADQGEYVLVSTLKAGDPSVTASPSVGQPANTATVTVKVTYTVLTVKKSDLSQAIQAKLAGQIDKSKQKLNGNFLNDTDVSVQSQTAPNQAVLALNVETTAVPIISETAVKKQAEGKKAGDVQQAINNWPGVKSVDVKLSPFWVSKVPKKDSKVTVKLVEDKAGASSGAP
jgi:hypothetical protein